MIILEVTIWVYTQLLGYAKYKSVFDPFRPLNLFILVWSTSVHFGPFWSTLVYFISIKFIWSTSVYLVQFVLFCLVQSIWFTSVYFGPFDLLQSIHACSVHFGLFCPIWIIQSTSVYSIQFGPLVHLFLFGPIWSIRSIWSISGHFGPIRCTYLRMGKYKFGLRVLLIIWGISVVIIW